MGMEVKLPHLPRNMTDKTTNRPTNQPADGQFGSWESFAYKKFPTSKPFYNLCALA